MKREREHCGTLEPINHFVSSGENMELFSGLFTDSVGLLSFAVLVVLLAIPLVIMAFVKKSMRGR